MRGNVSGVCSECGIEIIRMHAAMNKKRLKQIGVYRIAGGFDEQQAGRQCGHDLKGHMDGDTTTRRMPLKRSARNMCTIRKPQVCCWSLLICSFAALITINASANGTDSGEIRLAMDVLASLSTNNRDINLDIEVKNVSKHAVTISAFGFPWDLLRSENVVLGMNGKIIPAIMFVFGHQGKGETTLRPGESARGRMTLGHLRPGDYDMVGLLYCRVKTGAKTHADIPLSFAHTSFSIPVPTKSPS